MSTSRNHAERAPHRPSLLRALRKALTDAWLHLALIVAVNVIWVVLVGLPASLLGLVSGPTVGSAAIVTAAALTVIAVAAGNAVLFHVTNCIAHGDADWGALLAGIRIHFAASLRLLAFLLAVLALCSSAIYFYMEVLPGPGWRIIGFVCGYLIVLFELATAYSYPLLVEQRRGALSAVKRSALLSLDNPVYTIGLTAALAGIPAACVGLVLSRLGLLAGLGALGLCFVAAGFVALVANNALLELLRRYESTE